jgi:group I intron endonuclease
MVIYKTTNLINNKIYIGQDSKNNPKYLGSGVYFRRAVRKYGINNFKKEILKRCSSKEEMHFIEMIYIMLYNSTDHKIGYNLSSGGPSTLGLKFTQEQRIASSNRVKGSNNPMYGRKHSEKTRAIFKRKKSKQNNPMFGKVTSEETKRKISEAQSGEKAYWFGKKWDENKNILWKKVQEKISKKVIMLNSNGEIIDKYSSIREAARQQEIHCTIVRNICIKRRKNLFINDKTFQYY